MREILNSAIHFSKSLLSTQCGLGSIIKLVTHFSCISLENYLCFCYSFFFLSTRFRNPLPLWYFLVASLPYSILLPFQGCVILILGSTIPLYPNQNLSTAARILFSVFCPVIEEFGKLIQAKFLESRSLMYYSCLIAACML